MIAEDCSTAECGIEPVSRLVQATCTQARRVRAMFDRVSAHLSGVTGSEQDAEGGWRR